MRAAMAHRGTVGRARRWSPGVPIPKPGLSPPSPYDVEIATLDRQLDTLTNKVLALLVDNPNDHPEVLAARKSVALVQTQLDLLRAKAAATLLPVPPVASGQPGLKPQLDDATLTAATDEITRLERERDEHLANIDRIQANIRTLPRIRGQLGELERDRKRAAEALDLEVTKLAEAESQDSLISANRGDTFRIQVPANLPAQPNSPASWVMLMASAILATLMALGSYWSIWTRRSTTSTSSRGSPTSPFW